MFKTTIMALATVVAVTSTSAYAIGPGSVSRGGLTKQQQNLKNGHVAPIAYQIFCLRNQNECKSGLVGSVAFTPELMGKLNSVNRSINGRMIAREEASDTWTVNASSGDCEDFALTKRSKLIRAGVPSGALRMAVVRTSTGIGHAVLVVKTSAGEYVLDNLRPNIVKRSQTGYRFLQVATQDPLRWVKY